MNGFPQISAIRWRFNGSLPDDTLRIVASGEDEEGVAA